MNGWLCVFAGWAAAALGFGLGWAIATRLTMQRYGIDELLAYHAEQQQREIDAALSPDPRVKS